MSVKLLEEVLPIKVAISSIQVNMQKVSERIERELGEEQHIYVGGCINEWQKLSNPESPFIVGIDGGYIHAREGKNMKAGWLRQL